MIFIHPTIRFHEADHSDNRHESTENLKLKASEHKLLSTEAVRKLRAIIHSTEEQLGVHKKQALFLTHLTAKTVPKGLHCLPLRLSTEYNSLYSSAQQFSNQQKQFPNQQKLHDPNLLQHSTGMES
ncbi:unnamed protein product [Lactuca virosa]|uniref:Uncharacterized protein n=1 Tax=Lactuca virosa TaxID=75947 RepID=A0AAU9M6H0_9ASTR|nr:unnamed protein product [Lactuca virosa]